MRSIPLSCLDHCRTLPANSNCDISVMQSVYCLQTLSPSHDHQDCYCGKLYSNLTSASLQYSTSSYRGSVKPQSWTAYTAPVSSYSNLVTPLTTSESSIHKAMVLLESFGHAVRGRYVANSVGVHFAKRSVEAEADPQVIDFQGLRLSYYQLQHYSSLQPGHQGPALDTRPTLSLPSSEAQYILLPSWLFVPS